MKRTFEVLGWLTAVALLAFAGHAVLAQQAAGQGGRGRESAVVLVPGVAQEAQERDAGRRERERRRDLSPTAIMREARTLFVRPTTHLDKKYLEYKLYKYNELRDWDMALVEDERAADLVISIDKTALNYIFTITDPRTSVIVTSGKCVAVNGRLAAEYLGREIVKKIKDVRASSERREGRKKGREDEDEDDS